VPTIDAAVVWRVAVATLGGLAIGIERQRSGHAEGPHGRFAGIRTFTLIGLASGLAGWLWTAGAEAPAVVLFGGLVGLTLVAYFQAASADIDGTTEVAALVAIAAGGIAGGGATRLASGLFALTALLLVEKHRLHGWVQRLDTEDIRAGARFAVMAAVILPILPEGPFGPAGTIRPRLLWALVLFFSALSFVGVVAQRLLGSGRGYVLTGLVGGLLSSTSVTLTYARLSREHPESAQALASGTMAANAVLLPRVLVASTLLAPSLARALWPLFVAPFLVAVVLALRGLHHTTTTEGTKLPKNPLQVLAALEMAAMFQVVLFGVAFASSWFGEAGLYGSAAVLGLADMDALTVSMSDRVSKGTAADVAATAVAIGVVSNTLVKMTIAIVVGRGRFRLLAGAGLAAIALALGAMLVV
jgi:uncharacterized membrane protein (DUF4010 family)